MTEKEAARELSRITKSLRGGALVAPTSEARRALADHVFLALGAAGWAGHRAAGPRYGEAEPPIPAAMAGAVGEALVACGAFATADLAGGVLGGERVGLALRQMGGTHV